MKSLKKSLELLWIYYFEKIFMELRDIELKDREVKFKREIEELFFKLITASIDDKHKFEQKKGRRKDQLKTLGMFFN